MKEFVEGLNLAISSEIISTRLAKIYLNAYVAEQFGINFSDEQIKRIEKGGQINV